jgi:tetratricopeptide (TPR) repeat protein
MKHTLALLTGIAAALCLAAPMAASAAGGGGGGGGGVEAQEESKPPDYKEGVQAIKAGDFQGCLDWMTKDIAKHPDDADAYNYIGFCHRKLKQYPEAMQYYNKALELNPDHRGAHEYLGEAYLEMDKLDEAKKQLAVLDDLCWLPCEPYSVLKEAVQAYEKAHKS